MARRRYLAALGLALMLAAGPAFAQPDRTVTLLSYNVEGLPWPVRTGRSVALETMIRQLQLLRHGGVQPGLVALQEAFVPEAKAIGHAAGYRYMALGPGVYAVAEQGGSARDRAFMANRNLLFGEHAGKKVDSGLAIFSDFPILAVRRLVYSVCASFDCLSNKGALAVRVAVPGISAPLTVINAHLNSGTASGATRDHSNYAYFRQIDVLRAFILSVAASGQPILVAGDLNVGRRDDRLDYFNRIILGGSSGMMAAELSCRQIMPCKQGNLVGIAESIRRRKDWLLYRLSASLVFRPTTLDAPFGRASDGTMPSDHVGISATSRST